MSFREELIKEAEKTRQNKEEITGKDKTSNEQRANEEQLKEAQEIIKDLPARLKREAAQKGTNSMAVMKLSERKHFDCKDYKLKETIELRGIENVLTGAALMVAKYLKILDLDVGIEQENKGDSGQGYAWTETNLVAYWHGR